MGALKTEQDQTLSFICSFWSWENPEDQSSTEQRWQRGSTESLKQRRLLLFIYKAQYQVRKVWQSPQNPRTKEAPEDKDVLTTCWKRRRFPVVRTSSGMKTLMPRLYAAGVSSRSPACLAEGGSFTLKPPGKSEKLLPLSAAIGTVSSAWINSPSSLCVCERQR